jgi:glutamine phosphoribosylpyrophosphate amidotransferase
MCAVIGIALKSPTKEDFQKVRDVFLESSIRGLHATGMSFLPHWSNNVVTIKQAIPASEFVAVHFHNDNFKDYLNKDGNLYMIGHCRYSTSDLEYNQPIANDTHSIVHNGVITQEMPENWKKLYGYDCETKNDSELVLKSNNAIEEFPDASMAVCELDISKKLTFYRNGKRPIYMTVVDNGYFVTSTENIAQRANIVGLTSEVPALVKCEVDENMVIEYNKTSLPENFKDLQNALSN